MTRSALHYKIASRYLGVHEVSGSKSHPLIAGWIKDAAEWLPRDDSETAWCGCFRGHVGMLAGTGVPSEQYRAASWLRWGVGAGLDPNLWQQGDTVVMKRKGGFHVALFGGLSGREMLLLGGNQADSVCISEFALGGIVAVRR